MRRIARAFFAASIVLQLAAAAHALDLNRPPFQAPTAFGLAEMDRLIAGLERTLREAGLAGR